jgi:transcriptional regulator with XRE-family HTH domain
MSDDTLLMLGTRIRDIRKSAGLTQEELAEKAGFHSSYIGGLERAEKNITLRNLEKVATALNVEIYDLLKYKMNIKNKSYVPDKSPEINELLSILLSLESRDLKRAKILLKEMFQN